MDEIFKADFLKMVKMQIGPFGSEPSYYHYNCKAPSLCHQILYDTFRLSLEYYNFGGNLKFIIKDCLISSGHYYHLWKPLLCHHTKDCDAFLSQL